MIEGSNNLKMKSKENLYALFYEIISEIKGCKIEIEEEEFQENIQIISMNQLIYYIKDALNILINQKVYESKEKQKKKDFKEFSYLIKSLFCICFKFNILLSFLLLIKILLSSYFNLLFISSNSSSISI